MESIANRIRQQNTPFDKFLYRLGKSIVRLDMPVIPAVHGALYSLHLVIRGIVGNFFRAVYWTPMFRSRLSGSNRHLHIAGGGMPLITGPVSVELGDNCRLSSAITISGRNSSKPRPQLIVGNNVGIGWQTTIAVGSRIVMEDNVRIGGRAFFAGYPGHPVNAQERAAGLPDHESQVGEIILRKDVWLGTGCTVSAGVEIGEGTIVAAGSVVTRNLPPNVIAAGVPAKIIRSTKENNLPTDSAIIARLVR